MASESERRQQEQARQILYDDAHPHSNAGRPRARGVYRGRQPAQQQPAPQQRPAQRQSAPAPQEDYFQPRQDDLFSPQQDDFFPPQQEAPPRQAQPQPRARARSSFEQPVYSAPARTRAPAQVKEPKRKRRGGAVTWLLVLLVLLLLAVAGYLVFLLFNGGIGGLSLGGDGGKTHQLPPGGALLGETADAGEGYVAETFFVGDSNFERLRDYGLVNAGTVAAKVGIGAGGITSDAFIEVTGQDQPLTIAQTMAAVNPSRILVMMGTNDVPNMTADEFVATYKAALEDLRKSAPNADIVVAGIPPVANWKDSEMLNASAVRQYNEALLDLCETEGFPYLDTYAALQDESGYLPEALTDDGYHLTQEALEKVLQYYRTHAYIP